MRRVFDEETRELWHLRLAGGGGSHGRRPPKGSGNLRRQTYRDGHMVWYCGMRFVHPIMYPEDGST